MGRIEKRIRELGYELPEPPRPVASYVPAVRTGNLVMTSGQLPMVDGELPVLGAVGRGRLTTEEGAEQARVACLNALAVIKGVIGSLDKVQRVVKLTVFVHSMDSYQKQPLVANGASELLQEIFGEAGRHARSAVGVNTLPLNSPVEVELTVEVS